MKAIRAKVSGSRVRYMKEGFDLDLTYITPSLIAMGYPASGVEKTYRNDISEVAAFLTSRHATAFRVYNLSERKYDYAKFQHRVNECGFPDHHPPPLQLLLDIMNDMLQFMAQSEENVVVVHCLAGKGRTGVVCSCFLLVTGFYGNIYAMTKDRELREAANTAIRDFWNARGQGVRYPSQALYIYYFLRVVRRLKTMPRQIPRLRPAKKMLLTRVVLNGIPDYEASPRGGCTPFLQVLPAPSQHDNPPLLYNSSWQNPNFETYAADPRGSIVFETNCLIQGDILLRCFHANSFSMLGRHVVQMFHVTFNTDFFHKKCDLYRLKKKEVDEAHDNARFPDTFCLDCYVAPVVEDDDLAIDQDDQDAIVLNTHRLNQLETEGTCSATQDTISESRRPSVVQREPNLPPKANLSMMGWLYKQGGFVKSWKKRWFVARDGQLTYFSTASDPTPLGVVDLHGVQVDTAFAEETTARNKYLHYFKVIPRRRDDRTWFFGADTEQEMAKWIRVISAQACHGIVPSGGPSSAPPFQAVAPRRSSMTTVSSQPRASTFNDPRLSDSRVPTRHTSSSMIDFSASSGSVASNEAHRGSFGAVGFTARPTINLRHPSQVARVHTGSSGNDAFYTASVEASLRSTRESIPSVSGEEDEDDVSENFLRSDTVPQWAFTQSKPLPKPLKLSEHDRQTVLQQVTDDFKIGMYIYTADELETAAKLQQYVATHHMQSLLSGQRATIVACVNDALRRHQFEYAQQVIERVVRKEFPTLLDAMEGNPAMFVDTICGDGDAGDGAAASFSALRT